MRSALPIALVSLASLASCAHPRPALADAPPASKSPPPLLADAKDEDIPRLVREHYTKYEARIPMRDGVKLYTAFYVPKDHSRSYAILFSRTPYRLDPYGVDAYPKKLTYNPFLFKAGYIFAMQDVRGRFQSEGEFVDVRPYIADKKSPKDVDESSDAYDTIDWLVKNVPNNNGKVGALGISYPGFYAAMAAIDAHPALKAVSPQAPIADWFVGDDFHHNGALFLPHAFNFFSSFGRLHAGMKKWPEEFDYGTTDGYEFFFRMGPLANADAQLHGQSTFWRDAMAHPNYDAFWKARDTRPHLKNVKPAVLTVGGWFDAEDLFGTLATYHSIENQSPHADNRIVMGPWKHGGWNRTDGDALGDVTFGAKTSKYYQEKIEAAFFDDVLGGSGKSKLAEATVFETGTNEWRSYDAWPPKTARPATIYLREGSALTLEAPSQSGDVGDSYVSDPNKPVPYREQESVRMAAEYMIEDQRFAARRPDVLAYETAPLTEDLVLAGPIDVSLWVTTTGTDSDFVVKVVDVYSDDTPNPEPNPTGVHMAGYQELIRGEPFRGKFRQSFERPEAFRPGEPALIHFTLPDVNHAFRSGHRLMVQVQSTWFPLVDRNPQTFVDINTAKAEDFVRATEHVLRSKEHPSQITVRVVRGKLR